MHSTRRDRYVLPFPEIHQQQVFLVGGKGANLGELPRIDGIRVPPGFCLTTDAFRRVVADAPSIGDLTDRLSHVGVDDVEASRRLSAEIRRAIERLAVPGDVAEAIRVAVARLGDEAAWAVRSSATTEDLPTASFAGQHDTYLNVVGAEAILRHVRRCWLVRSNCSRPRAGAADSRAARPQGILAEQGFRLQGPRRSLVSRRMRLGRAAVLPSQ